MSPNALERIQHRVGLKWEKLQEDFRRGGSIVNFHFQFFIDFFVPQEKSHGKVCLSRCSCEALFKIEPMLFLSFPCLPLHPASSRQLWIEMADNKVSPPALPEASLLHYSQYHQHRTLLQSECLPQTMKQKFTATAYLRKKTFN